MLMLICVSPCRQKQSSTMVCCTMVKEVWISLTQFFYLHWCGRLHDPVVTLGGVLTVCVLWQCQTAVCWRGSYRCRWAGSSPSSRSVGRIYTVQRLHEYCLGFCLLNLFSSLKKCNFDENVVWSFHVLISPSVIASLENIYFLYLRLLHRTVGLWQNTEFYGIPVGMVCSPWFHTCVSQELSCFVARCFEVVVNIVHQLAALYNSNK